MNALPDKRGCRRKLFSFLFISGSCSFSLAVCRIAQTARIVGTETPLPTHIAGTLFVTGKSSKGAEAHATLRSNQRLVGANRMSESNDSSRIDRAEQYSFGEIESEAVDNFSTQTLRAVEVTRNRCEQ